VEILQFFEQTHLGRVGAGLLLFQVHAAHHELCHPADIYRTPLFFAKKCRAPAQKYAVTTIDNLGCFL
jgi:hypothetical protein